MDRRIDIRHMVMGKDAPLMLIAGPCVIEDEETTFAVAARLRDITRRFDIPFLFKASYDKANRSALRSFRGPGLNDGLAVLQRIKTQLKVPVISDVHRFEEIAPAAAVLDVLQIPAFLCRQTDFLLAAARTGTPINVKKGQFLAPWDMKNVVEKLASTGNRNVFITERGASFGYNNLVSDMRAIPIMQQMGVPVVFDATHSVQLPGGAGDRSGGQREFAPLLAKAAAAAGADGVFMEVHPDPDRALCDGANSLHLETLDDLLPRLLAIRRAIS
jgi:2-dehydro-3-deoxyphosphooctonate aldolase (KDO 8-P synthase)